MSGDVLGALGDRLQADLRLRFPDAVIKFAKEDDGSWMFSVLDGPTPWGEASTWFEDDDDLSPTEAERLLADITFNVADNLWPDDDTDPWPPCPLHGGHPLNPGMAGGIAAWICLRDPSVAIPVGALGGEHPTVSPNPERTEWPG